jgi:hydroxymethylglutaryl-CoA lyase
MLRGTESSSGEHHPLSRPSWPREVTLFEVGPRDGLQNEKPFIETEKKIELVNLLSKAGCSRIEVTSFAHPAWVPQMRDAVEVLAGIERLPGVVYSALVPNRKGFDRAAACGVPEVVTILSASESHNAANLNMSVAESLEEIRGIIGAAAAAGIRVRSYIATAFGCPMEGRVAPERVAEIAARLEEFGAYEISLGDTTGMAGPTSAWEVSHLVKSRLQRATVAAHFHQSSGMEFANVLASLMAGVDTVDGAAGGLGGCPFAPGATGNIATEHLVEMLARMGISTGIDAGKIMACGQYARALCAEERDGDGRT